MHMDSSENDNQLTFLDKKQRLASFRDELMQRGLSGFLVPHADEYQNEYLPACADRLAWLTGFTGSAGLAVILQDQAGIFVDGRYTLQVRSQVDLDLFVPFHLIDCPSDTWLSTVLKPGSQVGYDPWLHSVKEVETFRAACERAGSLFVPCDSNPVDAIWQDRPAPPSVPITVHPLKYAGLSSSEKRKRIAEKLQTDQVQCAILTAPESIAWLLNIRGGDIKYTPLPLSFAVMKNDAVVDLFIQQEKVSVEVRELLGPEVTIRSLESFDGALESLGHQRGRVLCDYGRTASWIVDQLNRNGAQVIQGDDPCALPKACKNPVEITGAREAHIRDGVAFCRFLSWLDREGKQGRLTELDAQAYLEARRRENALWQDLSFPTISGAGSNGAIVHYRATPQTNRELQTGTLYLVDSGAQYLDGTTDITRTIAIGRPTTEHRDRYTRVLKGHIALATARFPKGTSGVHLDALARRPLWDAGLDYDHGTGHGVGSYLGVHEGPQRISKTLQRVPLEPGMIVSNEPGFYKAGEYGIRLENLIVVIPCGKGEHDEREFFSFETLTLVPFDLSLIEPSLMTSFEREWINQYHRQVWQILTPLVDSETQSWLSQATNLI